MREEIIKRNLYILTFCLILFYFLSIYVNSYFTHKNLEENIVNISNILISNLSSADDLQDISSTVNEYTKNQQWLSVIVCNDLGEVLIDSDNDNLAEIPHYYIPMEELKYLENDLDDHRVYSQKNRIYYINEINQNLVVRTSISIQSNEPYIFSSAFFMFALIVLSILISIFFSRRTSKNIEDSFYDISHNLKQIIDGKYESIDTSHRYFEVSNALEDINIINNSIYEYIKTINEEKDKISFIINNMQQGLIIINGEEVNIINDYARKVLNIVKKQKIYGKYSDIIVNQRVCNKIASVIKSREDLSFDYFDKENDKIYSFILSYQERPWGNSEENNELVFISIIDVTEERKNDELNAEFIANASHELKTPITTISGFSELILNGVGTCDQKTKDYIYRIYNQSKYMKETIDELLYLSNLEYKQDENQINELVNLKEIIDEVFEEYQDMASKNNINLSVKAENGYVYGSEALLKHLVNNIVENAIKYNRENGSAEGKVYVQDNNVIVEVSDTGIGIDTKNIPKLFDRFYRIDASRNRSTGGTGLGLTIAKKICNVHKATIEVNSELGVGTTFKIIFKKVEK